MVFSQNVAGSGPCYKDAWHYRDGADAEIEREYDGNGNLVKDLDAGILRIEYNSLNLPQMIKFSDHSKHVYAYDATGRKLRAEYHTPIMVVTEPQVPDMGEEMPEQEEVLLEEQQQEWNEEEWGEEWEMEEEELIPAEMPDENGEVVEEPLPQEENNCKPTIFFEDDDIACEVTTVDYCGDFIYVNGKLKRMLFPGGYVTFRNDSIECPEYHFYITDHQGNVRIVANQDGTIEQINHYYPYGGLMGESTNSDAQPYKYNGKELDRHHGLDWYDYGARWYNGISWMNMDPHAESYYNVTPYGYCHNNPMNKIDPNGMDDYYTKEGVYLGTNKAKTDYIYITNDYRKLKDGKYAIKIGTRVSLPSSDISAKALSKILTHIVGRMPEVDLNELDGKQINVVKWSYDNYSNGINVDDQYGNCQDGDDTTNASTEGNNITAFFSNNNRMFETRSNIQNMLGVEEYTCHFRNQWHHFQKGSREKNITDNKKIFKYIMNHPTWNKTTDTYKELMIQYRKIFLEN